MVIPETANWPLDTLAAVTLIEVFPVFRTVAVCETFLPTTRLPKLKLLGVTWIAACDFVPPALTKPAQPISNKVGPSSRIAGSTRCCHNRPTLRRDRSVRFRSSVLSKVIRIYNPPITSRRGCDARSHRKTHSLSVFLLYLSQLVGRGRGWGPLKLK